MSMSVDAMTREPDGTLAVKELHRGSDAPMVPHKRVDDPAQTIEILSWEEITERRLAMEIRDMVRIAMMEDE